MKKPKTNFPFIKFFPPDHTQATAGLSLAAKGAWISILCYLHASKTPGKAILPIANWAKALGTTERELSKIFKELKACEVGSFSFRKEGILIVSNRMVREFSAYCKLSKERKKNGAKGGRVKKEKAIALFLPEQMEEMLDTRSNKPESKDKLSLSENSKPAKPDQNISSSPPTSREVLDFAAEQSIPRFKAESFFDYHESHGYWLNKHRVPINWRHKLKTWEPHDYSGGRKSGKRKLHPSIVV